MPSRLTHSLRPTAAGHLVDRATGFAALGDPARLAIVDDLAGSDRSPAELAKRHGLPPNLLAHHLGILGTAGLITRTVSSGDRRRRYVRLDHDALASILGSVGPVGPVGESGPGGRVVFVCTAATARSQLAAALWRERTGGTAVAAGTDPATEVHPGAVAAGRRAGLDLTGAVPRSIDEVATRNALVVTVCDRAHEDLGEGRSGAHWSVEDPVARGSVRAFDTCIAELAARIDRLAGAA